MKKLFILVVLLFCASCDLSCPTAENLCLDSCKKTYKDKLGPGCAMVATVVENSGKALRCNCYTKCPQKPAAMK